MTIAVVVLVPSGIVLAADSRQIIKSPSGRPRVDSDNIEKIIQLTQHSAALVTGQSTVYMNSSESPKSIPDIIRRARCDLSQNETVEEVTQKMLRKVSESVETHVTVTNIEPTHTSFYVAGMSRRKDVGELYRCEVPGSIYLERKTNDAGAVWNGDRNIINRILLGYDPRLFDDLIQSGDLSVEVMESSVQKIAQRMGLYINFQTMPLQDAIDLATTLIRTTIDLQRLSDGLVGEPGQFPTCGGEIDVAVITSFEGFRWVQRKNIKVTM